MAVMILGDTGQVHMTAEQVHDQLDWNTRSLGARVTRRVVYEQIVYTISVPERLHPDGFTIEPYAFAIALGRGQADDFRHYAQ